MRFLQSILLTLLLSAAAEYLLPWWSMAIVAFLVGCAFMLRPGKAFLAGFIAISLLWLCWSLWWDIPNEHLLSRRMAKVFSLPNAGLFITVTAVVGGLAGGMSAWSGAHFRRLISSTVKTA